jgi:hypothetical protein
MMADVKWRAVSDHLAARTGGTPAYLVQIASPGQSAKPIVGGADFEAEARRYMRKYHDLFKLTTCGDYPPDN